MERRDFMAFGAATIAAAGLSANEVSASQPNLFNKPLHSDVLVPHSLGFDSNALNGISEKMILSHFNNNYSGAIKRAKLIEESIARLDNNANPYELGSLKREHMIALNSMILHEYYFDNLGAAGNMNELFTQAINASFGSVPTWENEFKKTALSLGGGSGWVLLVYNERLKRLENVWSWDHLHGLWDSKIIIALDMYEHSYQMDYGANTKGYIEAFFKNLNWNTINIRINQFR